MYPLHPKSRVIFGLILGVTDSVRFDKCMMMCVHSCGIIQSSFPVLKILCASASQRPLSANPGQPLEPFLVSRGLPEYGFLFLFFSHKLFLFLI